MTPQELSDRLWQFAARIGDGGELMWDRQLDFCPDSLWLLVTGQKPEALPEQKAPPVHA